MGPLQIYDRRERVLVTAADRLLALGVALVQPLRRRRAPAAPRRILLLRLERIGDLLMALPAIADVQALAPQAEIDLVVGSWNATLARAVAPVRRVHTLDAAWLARGGHGLGMLLAAPRREGLARVSDTISPSTSSRTRAAICSLLQRARHGASDTAAAVAGHCSTLRWITTLARIPPTMLDGWLPPRLAGTTPPPHRNGVELTPMGQLRSRRYSPFPQRRTRAPRACSAMSRGRWSAFTSAADGRSSSGHRTALPKSGDV